ncbi:hypothetical protein [Desulfatitalea alkaliphila]|uniref:Uncharacterized protein n=1 Tax=Desulfatitalea alkaliphila TaxID=2929485 RepID=A0AA41R3T7_9BACT|nr:hypothetical protein [Desulfatitalea alkaliphila]MCJ8501502.1 hypothetical protein [Desulfatitalea alkaliphila]
MRISNFNLTEADHRFRTSATVVWEDSDRPEKEIFIETTAPNAGALSVNPHAFLVGCLIPAIHLGEKRIAISGSICPGLMEGLTSAMALMRVWSNGAMQPLVIEPQKVTEKPGIDNRGRAGMVYSGGIDSIATLRANMLRYPAEHPGAIKDCFFIHGFDIGGVVARGMKYHVFDRGLAAMERVTTAAGVEAIPVYTNIRHLCDDRDLWLNRFFGAVLAAVGHAFSKRVDLFCIAASYDLENLAPCGSHPLLDPLYSSFDLAIAHKDAHLKRIDKLRLVADWEPAFQNFRVCLANVEDRLNCGKCEKCVRTMTGLVAIEALHKTSAFAADDVTPEMFAPFRIDIRHREPFYLELLPALEKQGRMDLVSTIRSKLKGPATSAS